MTFEIGTILVDIADSCQLSCLFCTRASSRRGGQFMPYRDYINLISYLADSGPSANILLPFWTGESTLHPQFHQMLEYLVEKNQGGIIARGLGLDTNLNQLDDEVADLIMNCGQFRVLTISIDAHLESTYQKLRRGGNFRQLLKNAEKLLRIKQKAPDNKPTLVFQFLVRPENYQEAVGFHDYWKEKILSYDLPYFSAWHYGQPDHFRDQTIFIRRCDAPRGQSKLQREYEDLHIKALQNLNLIGDLAERLIVSDEYRPLPDGTCALKSGYGPKKAKIIAKRGPCSGPFTHLAFKHDLGAVLCCQDIDAQYPVGTAIKDSLELIWKGDRANKLREAHLTGNIEGFPGCKGCFNQVYPPFAGECSTGKHKKLDLT